MESLGLNPPPEGPWNPYALDGQGQGLQPPQAPNNVPPAAPQPGAQLADKPQPAIEAPSPSPGFMSRLKNVIQKLFGGRKPDSPTGVARPAGGSGLDKAAKLALIREAGRTQRRLAIVYNGQPRQIGPLSFRWRAKKPDDNPLLYAHCWLHAGKVEAFIPNRIEWIQLTDETYRSPWPIEVA